MWFIGDNEQRRVGSIGRLPEGPGRTTTVCFVPAPQRCAKASQSSPRLASKHRALPAEPNSVPGLDPWIGPDVCVRDWSEGGAVRRYATRSAGSERAQMTRDLSVNGEEREGNNYCQLATKNPHFKNAIFEIGTFRKAKR